MSEKNITFAHTMKRFISLLVCLPIVCGRIVSIVCIFSFHREPQYTATAIVACNSKQVSSGNIDSSTLSTSKEVVKSFQYMMTQSTTLQDAAEILHKMEDKEYGAYNAGVLAEMISVTQVEDTYFLNVSATASNRYLACDVANAVADASVNLAGEDGDFGFGQISILRRAEIPTTENSPHTPLKTFLIFSILVFIAVAVGTGIAMMIVCLVYKHDKKKISTVE